MIFAFSYQTQISKNLQFWWVWDLPSKVMPLATASWLWRSRCIRWVFYILLVVHPVFWIINFIVDSNWHWMPSTAICFTTRAIQFYWTWRLVWTHFIENKLKQIGGTYFFFTSPTPILTSHNPTKTPSVLWAKLCGNFILIHPAIKPGFSSSKMNSQNMGSTCARL